MSKLNEMGAIKFVTLLILIAGFVAGLYLVQHPTFFKPKANVENIEWVISNLSDPVNCITVEQGKIVATCPKVKFKVNVPQQLP